MTNPNNAVGTNGAFGGRTSVNAFNDIMAAFTGRGVISGWEILPGSGMTVAIGGDGTTRDVAVAEDNAGNKTSIDNISQAPVNLAIVAAPVTNRRIDAIVAYVDNPPSGTSTVVDNYGACGLIDVQGAVAASPSAPDESVIRTAITVDGGSGSTAYYVVLGYVEIGAGTTDITSDMITAGPYAQIGTNQISDGSVTSDKIDWTTSMSVSTSGGVTSYKLASGVLIQIGSVSLTTGTSATGDGRYWAFQNINFPTPFKDNNYYVEAEAIVGTGSIGNNPRATATAVTVSQANIGLQAIAAGFSRDVKVFAIGLWK